jgi:hypothetical protein
MHLVEKQQRRSTGRLARITCGFDGGADILHASHYGRKRNELRVRFLSNESSERGLSGPGRTPQDQRVQLSGFDRMPQGFTGAQEMLLPHELVQ